jgi:hypothetical protein
LSRRVDIDILRRQIMPPQGTTTPQTPAFYLLPLATAIATNKEVTMYLWFFALIIASTVFANIVTAQAKTGPAGATLQQGWLWIRSVTGSPSVGE